MGLICKPINKLLILSVAKLEVHQLLEATLFNTGVEKGVELPYVVESTEEFLVSTAAYRDSAVFEAELTNIFYRTWIYVAHESELNNPGDFKSTLIGLQPVIVARDQNGQVNVFLNACRHRGSILCREERGNTRVFNCPYHGWTYGPSGELIGIPGEDRYPPSFSKKDHGLISVPRVENYGGLIFASLNPDVQSLESFLGRAKPHIDYWLKRCAGGRYRTGTSYKYGYDGNWKFQAENVYDGYHAGFVHRSAYNTFRKFEGSFTGRHYGAVRSDGHTRGLEGGHGTLEMGKPLESDFISSEAKAAYFQKLVELNNETDAHEILSNRHVLLFPNVVIMDFNIRVIQPLAHDRTEVYSYPMLIDGIDESISYGRMNDVQTRVGVAGMVGADDVDVFHGSQSALHATGAKWLNLSRGLGKEEIISDGERIGAFSDETPQRAFWRHWQTVMGLTKEGE